MQESSLKSAASWTPRIKMNKEFPWSCNQNNNYSQINFYEPQQKNKNDNKIYPKTTKLSFRYHWKQSLLGKGEGDSTSKSFRGKMHAKGKLPLSTNIKSINLQVKLVSRAILNLGFATIFSSIKCLERRSASSSTSNKVLDTFKNFSPFSTC
jgi:hypothetical protein